MAAPPPLPSRGRPVGDHRASITPPTSPPDAIPPRPSLSSSPSSELTVPDLCGNNDFGSCLQSSYEAISKRHEEELHCLESLRSHIFKRQRADKEYAEQLLRINQTTERQAQFPPSTTSPIVQAWRVFLQVSERLQSQLASSADLMKSMIERVDDLIKNKRGAKKVCDDHRIHLDTEFTNMCNHVQDLRRDYRKHLRATEKCKNALQASHQKQAKASDIEKNRVKFVSAAKKLHTCHNDYALSIVNVNIHQEFYRRTLLPFTLNTLQDRMEMQITEWNNLLTEYSSTLDMSQLYQESFGLFQEAINQVGRETEYVQFIRDNTRDQPAIEHFEFDATLLSAPCAPPDVQPGKIAFNNLTNKPMTDKATKYETEITKNEQDIIEKSQEIEELMASIDESATSAPKTDAARIPRQVKMTDLRGQIYELQDKTACKQRQLALIQEILIPDSTYPPPLFDPLGEGTTDDITTTNDNPEAPYYSGSTVKDKKKGKAAETIKRMFRRRGGTNSDRTESISESYGGQENDGTIEGRLSVGGASAMDEEEEDEYQEPPEVAIEEEPWYYGVMDRKDAEKKCSSTGDYLVRYSDRQNKYVLTVHWNGQGRHFVIQEVPDPSNPGCSLYRFEDKAFTVVRDLLDYHVQTGIPVTRNSSAVLSKFVSRIDKWTIRREDVQLGRKLGKGAFGEVCEAFLAGGSKAAVKTCRETISAADKRKFLQEADILKQYDHPNVVRLIGVCAERDPVYIIMEILPGGSFLDFLRKRGGQQSKKKLTVMVSDAGAGMDYLESMKCIHRDLAARNCLVGENDIVKISDFGMSREEECGMYQVSSGSRQIPIKWTAPEALNFGRYTTASDVWSFGVLLWETFSLGSTPYPGMSNNEAREQVDAGYRMPPPKECPPSVYQIMQECWQYDEEDRPSFNKIHGMLVDAQSQVFN